MSGHGYLLTSVMLLVGMLILTIVYYDANTYMLGGGTCTLMQEVAIESMAHSVEMDGCLFQ